MPLHEADCGTYTSGYVSSLSRLTPPTPDLDRRPLRLSYDDVRRVAPFIDESVQRLHYCMTSYGHGDLVVRHRSKVKGR